MATYYLAVNGQSYGPYSVEQLAGMNLTPASLVWNETMPDWVAASTVPELQSLFYQTPPQPVQQAGQQQYQQPVYGVQRAVGFGEAIKMFFSNYATFSGRSSRSEFWYVTLFNFLVSIAITMLGVIFIAVSPSYEMIVALKVVNWIYSLAVLIPGLALAWRRLHDIGKSGGWWFIWLIPLVGAILLLVWFCTASDPEENEYGPVPNVE